MAFGRASWGGGVYSFSCQCCASLGRLFLEIKCAVRVMSQVLRLYGAAVFLCVTRLESSTPSLSYMNCPELVQRVPTPLANTSGEFSEYLLMTRYMGLTAFHSVGNFLRLSAKLCSDTS